MKTHGHQELIGVFSGQEGHKHILRQKTQKFWFFLVCFILIKEKLLLILIIQLTFQGIIVSNTLCLSNDITFRWNKKSASHPVVCSGDHQRVWQQDGSFGLLDVSDRHHWDGDLGWTNTRMNISALRERVSLCWCSITHPVGRSSNTVTETLKTSSVKETESHQTTQAEINYQCWM